MKLSFIIPCYRSEKTVMAVIDEIVEKVKERPEYGYEIITVNDGSPDNVLALLLTEAESRPYLKVIDLARNFGQHAAMMAGLSYAEGEYIVFQDDDAQCPVDKLWELIKPLDEGYDISTAQYSLRERKESFFRRAGSWFNDCMMQIMLEKPRETYLANFFAIKRFVAEEMLRYKNPYPYMDGLLLRTSRKIASVPMADRERLSGTSTYTLRKLISLILNGFTAFSIKPLRIATFLGTLTSFFGFFFGLYVIIRKLLYPELIDDGYSSLMAVILFVGGMIMLLLGICGEYIGRIYICINNSPQYVVRQAVNVETRRGAQDEG